MPPLKARTVLRQEIKREESWPAVEPRDGMRRGVERGSAAGMNARLARRELTLRLGCTHHPDSICRTAGYVIRMSGGVGGGRL